MQMAECYLLSLCVKGRTIIWDGISLQVRRQSQKHLVFTYSPEGWAGRALCFFFFFLFLNWSSLELRFGGEYFWSSYAGYCTRGVEDTYS